MTINSLIILYVLIGSLELSNQTIQIHSRLSDYAFFQGPLAQLRPAQGVIPYDLNTPLFSDYAFKKRFVYIPKARQAQYNGEGPFEFPTGTILIKNFYYPADFRKPEEKTRIIETRLLIHENDGWTAWPYLWNDEQTDAVLEIAGDSREVKWTDLSGKKKRVQYLVPSANQCKGCHTNSGKLLPIGPAARHLNRPFDYPEGRQNQLSYWADRGMLAGLPDPDQVPANAIWNHPESGTLDQRARSWLDINCGHCHTPGGSGSTSGLLLDIYQNDPVKIGINKLPVAAGRGSGNLSYDIVPGKPNESILVHRMESNDPGVRMPEIGRSIPDKEGIDLIRQWIKEMSQEGD